MGGGFHPKPFPLYYITTHPRLGWMVMQVSGWIGGGPGRIYKVFWESGADGVVKKELNPSLLNPPHLGKLLHM